MTWYQISYCLAGSRVWHTDGGWVCPRKFYTRQAADKRELELLERYKGASTMIVRVDEIPFSDLATKVSGTMRQYTGELN